MSVAPQCCPTRRRASPWVGLHRPADAQMRDAYRRQQSTQTAALGRRVDADDVDLAEAGFVGVDFGPVEAQQGVGLLIEGKEQPLGVEPGFGAPLGQVGSGPATLFGCVTNAALLTRNSSASSACRRRSGYEHRRMRQALRCRARTTHLHELPNQRQPKRRRSRLRRFECPICPKAVLSIGFGQRSTDHRGTDTASAGLRVHHQLRHAGPIVVPCREIQITDDFLAAFGREGEQVVGALISPTPAGLGRRRELPCRIHLLQ